MITVVYSTHKNQDYNNKFKKHISHTIGGKNFEILEYQNNNEFSLTEIYNKGLEDSSNDIVVFCHNDIIFETKNWGNKLIKHFKRNPDYGILGVAGSTSLPKSAMWWEDKSKMRGIVNHKHEDKQWESKYSNNLGNKLDPVVLVDGLFIVIHKNRIKKNFNEDIKGFHMYDVSFCFENYTEGVDIGVLYDIRLTHLSIGQTNQQWEDNRKEFAKLNKDKLPIKVLKKKEDKLKVLLSCLYFKNLTGSELYVYELAKNLNKLNCDVSIVTPTLGEPLVSMVKKEGIEVFNLNEPPGFKKGDGIWGFNTPNGFIRTEKGRLYKISEVDFDIIHTQHKPITEAIINFYPNIKKVSTIHSEVINLEHPYIHPSIKKYISIRPKIKNMLIDNFNIDEENVVTIYNPIDNEKFKNSKQTNNNVLFVGTIDHLRKDSIYDILEYCKKSNKELWLVGRNTSNYLNDLLSNDIVKYFPPTDNVHEYMSSCDETAGIMMGRTTIEGWMCGKPGWIYEIDDKGKILNKSLHQPPLDIDKFYSKNVAKQIRNLYLNVINSKDMNGYKFNGRFIEPDNTKNWGDLIPYKIIKELSKSEKITHSDVFNVENPNLNYKVYSTGSVMRFTKSDSIVWGTGCIEPGSIGEKPKKVYSVRGPLTRDELIKRGIDCPEVYGDPALLYPLIYNPKIVKKYKWGIIPHYIEYDDPKCIKILKNLEKEGVKIIDICAGEEEFIDELLEVENVVSSSLHGLIMADAYNIPNARVNLSNKLIGGHFKFRDYYISVGRELDLGLQLTQETRLKDIEDLNLCSNINFNPEEYLQHSPWVNNEYDLF